MAPLFVEMEIWDIQATGLESWLVTNCILLKEKGVKNKTAWLLHVFCSPADLFTLEAHRDGDVPRPLTTDLIKGVIKALAGEILWVAIDDVKEFTLCGYVKIQQREKGFRLEGDAVVLVDLAIVANVPILASQEVLNEVGIKLGQWEEIIKEGRRKQLRKELEELDESAIEKYKV